MITRNKIEQREVVMRPQRAGWVKIVGLVVLLVVVTGGTFGVMWLVRGANSGDTQEVAPTNEETPGGAGDDTEASAEADTGADAETGAETSAEAEATPDGSAVTYSGVTEVEPLSGEPLDEAVALTLLGEIMGEYAALNPGRALEILGCIKTETETSCELVDPMNGRELKTALVAEHPEWQWLLENATAYGFVGSEIAPWRIMCYNG